VGPLGDSLARLLEAPHNERVDMSGEEDEFSNLVTSGLQARIPGPVPRLAPP